MGGSSSSDDELPLSAVSEALAPVTSTISFAAGARIFEEADSGDQAYLIDSGYVEITRLASGGKQVLAVLGPGEVFGEMAAIDGLVRSASATAVHDTVLVPINRHQIDEALRSANPLTQLMMRTAINRLRTVQRADFGGRPDAADEGAADKATALYQQSRTAAAHYVRMASELQTALDGRHLQLYFQPIVSLADGRAAGSEALLRWRHPSRGLVNPGEFIPAAESTGLIVPIGVWVLEQALVCLAQMHRTTPQVFLTVNISPRQLESEKSVEHLARCIEASDADANFLKLEITEQALHDPALAMAALQRLRATGASIAIDDFGTGYSNLNYLSRYPVDTLKIDGSFVNAIEDDYRGQRVVLAILSVARELGMAVVAEGIETQAQFEWLQSHGCRFGQGFLMARPMPYADAAVALRRSFRWE